MKIWMSQYVKLLKGDFKVNQIEGIFFKCMATSQMIELKIPDKIIDAMCEVGVKYPELCACILLELKHNL